MKLQQERNPEVLHSWKDISTYTGRSVRTVQRWEQMFHFPVHRTSGELKGSVMAFRQEIDAWLRARALRPGRITEETAPLVDRKELQVRLSAFHDNAEIFRTRLHALQSGTERLADTIGKISKLHVQLSRSRFRNAG